MDKGRLRYLIRNKKYEIENELEKTQLKLQFMQSRDKKRDFDKRLLCLLVFPPGVLAIVFFLVCSAMILRNELEDFFAMALCFCSTIIWISPASYAMYDLLKHIYIQRLYDASKASIIAKPSERNPIEVLNRPSKQTIFTAIQMNEWKIYRYSHYLDEIKRMTEELEGISSNQKDAQDVYQKMEKDLESFVLYVDVDAEYDLPKKKSQQLFFITALFLLVGGTLIYKLMDYLFWLTR